MMLRLCLSWSRGMTYKHLHILSWREVFFLCILPNTHAHQPYLTGILIFCWPQFNAGIRSARSYNARLTAESWMLLDGRLLASGRLLGLYCLLDQNLT